MERLTSGWREPTSSAISRLVMLADKAMFFIVLSPSYPVIAMTGVGVGGSHFDELNIAVEVVMRTAYFRRGDMRVSSALHL